MLEIASSPFLELDGNRVIVLKDRHRTFRLTCRRVLRADWLAYFAAIEFSTEQDGKNRISTMDIETPRKLLAERVLIEAEGYEVSAGLGITDLPNWQTRIPLSHRLELGRTLADVRLSIEDPGFVIHPEGEEVLIDAAWSAQSFTAEDGSTYESMQKYVGLKHVLKPPTEAQHKRYNQQASRSLVVGGSRSGKTIYGGAQAILCVLYDELVIEVEGYRCNGQPLTDPAAIAREMDLHHKFIAAQELFAPRSTVTAEPSDGEAE